MDDVEGTASPPDVDLICTELLELLEPDLREIAVLRLSGYTNREIKDITGCPLRSIERRLQLIRTLWVNHANQ